MRRSTARSTSTAPRWVLQARACSCTKNPPFASPGHRTLSTAGTSALPCCTTAVSRCGSSPPPVCELPTHCRGSRRRSKCRRRLPPMLRSLPHATSSMRCSTLRLPLPFRHWLTTNMPLSCSLPTFFRRRLPHRTTAGTRTRRPLSPLASLPSKQWLPTTPSLCRLLHHQWLLSLPGLRLPFLFQPSPLLQERRRQQPLLFQLRGCPNS